jgi:DNA polymerase-3 subunit alpha
MAGLNSPKELVARASEISLPAMALTDFGLCGGFPKFVSECNKAKIKPVLGLEIRIVPDRSVKERGEARRSVLLLAKNRAGYRNLLALCSEGYLTGFYNKPRIDFDFLMAHAEGLICTTSDLFGHIPALLYTGRRDTAIAAIRAYKAVFGDDFYIEIMRHKFFSPAIAEDERRIMDELQNLARDFGVKCFCSNDVRYAVKEDYQAHDVLTCFQGLRCVKDTERPSLKSDDYYLKTPGEMAVAFSDCPELLTTTMEIVDKVDSEVMEAGGDYVPGADISGDHDPEEFLRDLVVDGMKQKGLYDIPEYRERMDFELKVFSACGYVRYFLVLWDFINAARTKKIRIGAGRGSAAGSICLYALGVTKLDPIKYGLLFERFLSVETSKMIEPADFGLEEVL